MKRLYTLKIALVAVAVELLWFGASASAAAGADGYGAVAGQQAGGGSGGTLPFTGSDLLGYVGVAAAIVAAGVVLRAIARRGAA